MNSSVTPSWFHHRQRWSWTALMLVVFVIIIVFTCYSVITPYTEDYDGIPVYSSSNCNRDWPTSPKTHLDTHVPTALHVPHLRGYPAPILGDGNLDTPFPRIIHQIWHAREFPEQWRDAQQSCHETYKDYQYMIWNFEDSELFIAKHHPWLLSTWRTYPYDVLRADLLRYLILYHYGGIYLDVDISCIKSFDPYVQTNISSIVHTVVRPSYPSWYGIDVIWSKPGSPLMWEVLVNAPYVNRWYGLPYTTVMFGAGTVYFGNVLNAYPCQDHITVVPNYFFTEKYFVHHHASAWHHWDGYVILFFYKNYKVIIPVSMLLAFIMGCIYYRRRRRTLFSSPIGSPKASQGEKKFFQKNIYHKF